VSSTSARRPGGARGPGREARSTPHIGYVSVEDWELQFADVFDQINAFAAGSPTNVVNPEVLVVNQPDD
jgi:phosphoglycerate dehydrogenase-like enzyme